jgi:hypothetical protein
MKPSVMPVTALSLAANSSALQKAKALLIFHMNNVFNLTVFLCYSCQNFVHITILFGGKGRKTALLLTEVHWVLGIF